MVVWSCSFMHHPVGFPVVVVVPVGIGPCVMVVCGFRVLEVLV